MGQNYDEKVRKLIRFDGDDAQAIVDQIGDVVQYRHSQGATVGIVACVVYTNDKNEVTYEPCFSRLPMEISLWAAEKIKRRLFAID